MACNCGKKSTSGRAQPWVLTLPNGTRKAYTSEIEAAAAKARLGGSYRQQ